MSVICPKCQLKGPAVSCREDAEQLAHIHDDFHHAGKPAAKAVRA